MVTSMLVTLSSSVDGGDMGQVDGPEGHGPLLHQIAVLGETGFQAHVLALGNPPEVVMVSSFRVRVLSTTGMEAKG